MKLEMPETVTHPALEAERPWHGEVMFVAKGRPPSFNTSGARGSNFAFHREKKSWQDVFAKLLMSSAPGRQWSYAEAWATLYYEKRLGRKPDEDNYRPLLAKALGDALDGGATWRSAGGRWLPDDSNDFFRFRAVEFETSLPTAPAMLFDGAGRVRAPATAVWIRYLSRCDRKFAVKGVQAPQRCVLPADHVGECRLLSPGNPRRR